MSEIKMVNPSFLKQSFIIQSDNGTTSKMVVNDLLEYVGGIHATKKEIATLIPYVGGEYINWGGQKRTESNFDKTSSTTLSDVTGLSVNVEAGGVYYFETTLFTTSNSAGGVKIGINGTCSASSIKYDVLIIDAGATFQRRVTSLGSSYGATAVANALVKIYGTITISSDGLLNVQFAQNASNGTRSTVESNSTFIVNKIA